MKNEFTHKRRKLLGTAASLAIASFFGVSSRSMATLEDVEKAISEFGGGVSTGDGKITLSIPEIAENGHSVPVSVVVESPMSEDDYVASVMILAPGNPLPEVATLHFTTRSGKAAGSTRMRLAQTQDVMAVAKMKDGTLFKDVRHVRVTIGGCGS